MESDWPPSVAKLKVVNLIRIHEEDPRGTHHQYTRNQGDLDDPEDSDDDMNSVVLLYTHTGPRTDGTVVLLGPRFVAADGGSTTHAASAVKTATE